MNFLDPPQDCVVVGLFVWGFLSVFFFFFF